jgi:hypothetical protein
MQATQLDAYVARQQEASRQQAGGHSWLVTQQQLDQEAADCAAGLAEIPRIAPCLAELLGSSDSGGDWCGGGLQEAGHKRELVAAAVSLSVVVADLLKAAR